MKIELSPHLKITQSDCVIFLACLTSLNSLSRYRLNDLDSWLYSSKKEISMNINDNLIIDSNNNNNLQRFKWLYNSTSMSVYTCNMY